MVDSLNLRQADRLEVTVIVDNYTDLTLVDSTETFKRAVLSPPAAPLAEHGLSCLLRVFADSEEHAVLMDTGMSPVCLLHNADFLNVDFSKIDSVVLSHGHCDHFGGLFAVLSRAPGGLPLVLHPDAFLRRRVNIPITGHLRESPVLKEDALRKAGAVLHKVTGPSTLASDLVLVSGEVERVTDFEKGFPWAEAMINGRWVAESFRDDQALAVDVKNKGLVVVAGCSHAGIINTVRYVQKLAKADTVHAVLGGFHLGGPIFEPIVEETIEEMRRIAPRFVVPMHCTGWKAVNRFAQVLPEQFILNSVGTTYTFG